MRLVIVGGVAGGMSCAARARRLNETAEIIVLERGGEVSFANCGLPYYVSGEIADQDKLLVQTPERLHEVLGIDVRVNSEVVGFNPNTRTLEIAHDGDTYELIYDSLVLSPGALATRPPIPGIDSKRVMTLRTVPDALEMKNLVDAGIKKAVVLGAGFIGLEAAEALAHQGLPEVHVVELLDHVLPPLEAELAALVTDELERIGVQVHDGIGAHAIEAGAEYDQVVLADGTKIEAELIVLSVGVKPDTKLFADAGLKVENAAIVIDHHGRTNLENVWAVGDATLSEDEVTGLRRVVALAGPANRAGRQVADHIFSPGHAQRLPKPIGTAIVRVGKLTAALTGANRHSLEQAGIKYHTVHLHPANHAGYFPGAEQMHLLVHFDEEGKVLGAQGVGPDGVDKRIDVFATAIRGELTVADLIDLDLAYSPPYGSAKDPVNMAGMMASNVLDGVLNLWYADEYEQLKDEVLFLDVRGPSEMSSGYLPGSLRITHTELRDHIDKVRDAAKGRPVRVYCASGIRSYLAHRILVENGFDSANLSGGMLTFKAARPDAEQILEYPNR